MNTDQLPKHAPLADNHPFRAAVIINPRKLAGAGELQEFKFWTSKQFRANGWEDPLWFETTARTLGRTETLEALAAGVDVVAAAGGDGTIRTVAQRLLGSTTPLGILPLGTGNLLARGLGIPYRGICEAVDVICRGEDRRIDAGCMEVDRTGSGEHTERHLFLVMCGMGIDAAIMAGTGEKLKQRLGHAAYVISAANALRRPATAATVTVGRQTLRTSESRGVVIGNFGTLTMGLELMPHADPSDGVLDAIMFTPKRMMGWVKLIWEVGNRKSHHSSQQSRMRGESIQVRSSMPEPVQIDGDSIGAAYGYRCTLQPGALMVRAPSAAASQVSASHGQGIEAGAVPV